MRPDWLLIGHFGGANVGDEAMLAGVLTFARDHGVSCRVMVSDVADARRIHGGQPSEWVRASALSTISQISNTAGLAFCGGTHLHDEFSGSRLFYHWASLAKYCVYLWLARLSGRKVVMIGHGVGRLDRRVTRAIVYIMLLACHRVTVRDSASAASLRVVRGGGKAISGFDLAAVVNQRVARSVTPTKVVLAPRAAGSFDFHFWYQCVVEVLNEVGVENTVLMPFQTSWPANDGALIEDLASQIQNRQGVQIEIVRPDGDPRKCIEHFSNARVVVAGRYHAAVLSILSGCPVLVVPYESKLQALADEVGIGDQVVAPGLFQEQLRLSLDFPHPVDETWRLRLGALRCAEPLARLSFGGKLK